MNENSGRISVETVSLIFSSHVRFHSVVAALLILCFSILVQFHPSSSHVRMSSILILGAGELGLPIIQSLSSLLSTLSLPDRPTLTVLLRPSTISSPSESKSKELAYIRTLGVNILAADLSASTVSELASHFKNYDIIISCTGFSGGAGTQMKLARAVLEAGVNHYYPWQFGVDYDIIGPDAAGGLFREQCQVRELLRAQEATKWTIVSTGMFTSFLFEPFFGVVGQAEEGVVVRALGSWENQVTVTTPEDIGRIAAELVLRDTRTGVVYTAGDTVSYHQVADLVEQRIGKEKVRKEVWNLDYLRDELEQDPENAIKKYRVVFAEGRGVSWKTEVAVNHVGSIRATDVRSFLASKEKLMNQG
ncbi:MAG: hypothetical protein L6R41_004585 [Letrouitia leprolyta]|nr:MAG: hypothetical protein L6R41_004585 [Letrouitia leprolyta]